MNAVYCLPSTGNPQTMLEGACDFRLWIVEYSHAQRTPSTVYRLLSTVNPQTMLEGALRLLLFPVGVLPTIFRQKADNARRGIKTTSTVSNAPATIKRQKADNARRGIKTVVRSKLQWLSC